ncbi:MAG: ATP-binding protein [Candidatus Binatia bacterium]
MVYYAAVPLFAAIAILGLSIFVYSNLQHTELGQVFAFLATTLVFWNLNFLVLYSVADYDLAFNLTRCFRVGSNFMAPAILHIGIALQRKRSETWRVLLGLAYLAAVGLTGANAFDLVVSRLQWYPWGYYWVGGPFYVAFAIVLVLNFLGAFVVLISEYRTTDEPRTRLQLKFWLLGAAVALLLGATNFLPVYGVPFYPLGNLGSVAWAGVVAYAIVRHRLMDIQVVATKGMAYAAALIALIVPTLVSIMWLQRHSFGQIHPDFSFAIFVILVVVGVLFPRLHSRAEARIERSLFPNRYEYRSALTTFARSIVRILDHERLLRELAATLSATLGLDRVAIALLDPDTRVFVVHKWEEGAVVEVEFPERNEFVTALRCKQEIFLREELEANTEIPEYRVLAQECRTNGWEVCIPLTSGAKLAGFISLGHKKNLRAFYAEDLALLETLSAEASVALENARLYQELRKSQDIIRRADRLSALGTLAAGIAHEIRNPLVSIQTFFQLAPERLHDEEFLTSFLSIASGEVKRISGLINELLSFARSPNRVVGPIDLNEIAERVGKLFEPEARKNGVALVCTLSSDLPLISADGDQIKQVVINLILNAIQATNRGGRVSVVSRTVERSDGCLSQLEIRDTGIGIPREQLDDIFNPFFTTKDAGTGLGLAIAHQIIAEHGGSITAESEPGCGTSFIINLPSHTDSKKAVAMGAERESASRVHSLRGRKAAY